MNAKVKAARQRAQRAGKRANRASEKLVSAADYIADLKAQKEAAEKERDWATADAKEAVDDYEQLSAEFADALKSSEREAFMRAAQEVRSFLADEPLEAFTRLPEAIESLADRDWRREEES